MRGEQATALVSTGLRVHHDRMLRRPRVHRQLRRVRRNASGRDWMSHVLVVCRRRRLGRAVKVVRVAAGGGRRRTGRQASGAALEGLLRCKKLVGCRGRANDAQRVEWPASLQRWRRARRRCAVVVVPVNHGVWRNLSPVHANIFLRIVWALGRGGLVRVYRLGHNHRDRMRSVRIRGG